MGKQDKKIIILIISILIFYYIGIFIGCKNKGTVSKEYITNLETQINELQFQLDYDNFSLNDSLNQ